MPVLGPRERKRTSPAGDLFINHKTLFYFILLFLFIFDYVVLFIFFVSVFLVLLILMFCVCTFIYIILQGAGFCNQFPGFTYLS